jgi:endonuclease-3
MRHIPAELRFKAHHWILLHGRYVCKALRPDCLNCGIQAYCKQFSR